MFSPWQVRAGRLVLGVWLVVGVPRYVAYYLDWVGAPGPVTFGLAVLLGLALLPVAVWYFRRPIDTEDPFASDRP